MKKRIFFTLVGCLTVLSLISCHPDYTHYTYINQTASTITIECYYGNTSDDEVANPEDLYETIMILPGQTKTVTFDEMTFVLPFRWRNGLPYLLVKNNAVAVFERYSTSTDKLLYLESYTLVSSSETVRNYEYVFTEEYFKDGKPVE